MTFPHVRVLAPAALSTVLSMVLSSALGAGLPGQAAPGLHVADVQDVLLWKKLVLRERGLLEELRERVPECPPLELRAWLLLWRSDEATAAALHGALEALRHETGARVQQQAAASVRSLLRDYEPEDFGRVAIKVTWVGPQTEPVPGLAVHSTSRIFDVMPFRAFRRRGIHYDNDDLPVFRSFAATGPQIGALVRAVLTDEKAPAAMLRTEPSAWALTILDTGGPRRPNHVELLLDAGEARAMFDRMAAALPDNPLAREVLATLQASF